MEYLLIILGVLAIGIILFITIHPTFGGSPSKQDIERYLNFNHYKNGKFVNQSPTDMKMDVSTILSLMKDSLTGKKNRSPQNPIPISIDWNKIDNVEDSLTWFGHSTMMLTLDKKKILIDPMFGPSPSPVSFVGTKRYSEDLLYVIEKLPQIDVVLITHDHYDHLDYPSIIRLKDKVGHFFVPLGVAAHLMKWGVKEERITECNWWEEKQWDGLTIASVPSQHFSGRGLFNRNSTLWNGWVILGENLRIYTSGDGGYGPHFKQIGEKYGPFDLTLMEGGQYDKRWSQIHMQPEESVQAHLDVKGKNMMLIHWGAFTLAYHSWTDPVERAIGAAKHKKVNLIAPNIGETVILNGIFPELNSWWKVLSTKNTLELESSTPQ
ncbi:L-ascorbate metabolism protein UlaG (beta-lactamase superfamily) [Bacillus niacini]|uniref:L-ascorbate metabolism protein UlaG (Beta-lactamase superfamily) n=1 Tax=Neobacillus niacini TaxID=86668 RepID=A0A852TH60_9BACI|nr:MBL fold metallo-hydrolase [Neobacillus niacini]NYE06927.1 L-ascorbate metabolism protein UlaG (beta-lactamase superfamily) [Neobacillus niacini]